MVDEKKKEHFLEGWRLPIGLFVLVVGVWLWWLFAGVQWTHGRLSPPAAAASTPAAPASIGELGQVGDAFGGINALFAALAGAGVFWAGYLQQRTLIATRNALVVEKARFDKQQLNEEVRHNRQQYEATFFQLLAVIREMLQDMRIRIRRAMPSPGSETHTVAEAMEFVLGDGVILNSYFGSPPTDPDKAFVWASDHAQENVFDENEDSLGPLFMTLFELFEHVATLEVEEPELARRFANIARAQLSNSHLLLLALYACTGLGRPLVATVSRFHLLAPFADHTYLRPMLQTRYSPSAFGL